MSGFDTRFDPHNPFACCFECKKRYPACSDHCEEHAKAREIRAEQNRKERLEKALGRADKMRAMRNARHK